MVSLQQHRLNPTVRGYRYSHHVIKVFRQTKTATVRIATFVMGICKLPQEAKHLAWLNLDTEAGQEYWLAMNLAGDYASACHHQIRERMAIGLRETPLAMIEIVRMCGDDRFKEVD